MPVFQAAYREARRAAMSQANARLQQTASAAVSALLKVMVDPSTPASVRVRAADCVLARGNQGLVNEDLDVRLGALKTVPHLPPGCSRRAGGKRPWGVRERAGADPDPKCPHRQ